MCVCVCVCVCVRACVRVCVYARACGCTRVLNITHVFAGVCLWKKPGRARGGENVIYVYIYIYTFILYSSLFLIYLLEPMCSRKEKNGLYADEQ